MTPPRFKHTVHINFETETQEIASELFSQLTDVAWKTVGVKWTGSGLDSHELSKEVQK